MDRKAYFYVVLFILSWILVAAFRTFLDISATEWPVIGTIMAYIRTIIGCISLIIFAVMAVGIIIGLLRSETFYIILLIVGVVAAFVYFGTHFA